MDKKKLGNLGEKISIKFLLSKNYRIIRKNFHSRYGEIDIIAIDKNGEIAFIEVKTRHNSFEEAFESVTKSKRIKLYKTAEFFYLTNPKYENFCSRFDVIAIVKNKSVEKIRHLKNAFSPILF